MTTTLAAKQDPAAIMQQVIVHGDLAQLNSQQRVEYYNLVCESIKVNPLTKPLAYIELNGKLVLYALRDCTDQLRRNHGIKVEIVAREKLDDVYVVTARATMPDGRTDESIGAVPLSAEGGEWATAQSGKRFFKSNGQWTPLRGDTLANALMKCETKAKRRVTLSIVGLGILDETEVETIPGARVVSIESEAPKTNGTAKPLPSPVPNLVCGICHGNIYDTKRLRADQVADATHRAMAKLAENDPTITPVQCCQNCWETYKIEYDAARNRQADEADKQAMDQF